MKKYLLGIFAIALAIGFSAFTTTKETTSNFFYGLNAAGDTYRLITVLEDNCHGSSSNICVLGYEEAQTAPFSTSSIPSGWTQEGSSNKVYFED